MPILSLNRIKKLKGTIGRGKFKRLVNDRVLHLKYQYKEPYPKEVTEELDELIKLYVEAATTKRQTQSHTKTNNTKLSYKDKKRIKNIYNHR